VLGLVDGLGHATQVPLFCDLVHCLGVDGQVAQRRLIFFEACRCGSAEVVVMRGAEEEYAFATYECTC
jgi:hypothetical protein